MLWNRGRVSAALLLGLESLAIVACGSDDAPTGTGTTTPAPPVSPGIRAVVGATVDDTVATQPLQATIVEVRGAGGALVRAGVVVRFEARPPDDTVRARQERAVFVCPLSAAQCGVRLGAAGDTQIAVDTTDAAGRAKVQVRLGTVAGLARVIISVPELGLRDSLSFTVRPGNPAQLRFRTRDTTVSTGTTLRLPAPVRDQFGNARSEPVTYTSSDPAFVFDTSGTTTINTIGIFSVVATAGRLVDTARVSVLPRGRLVVWRSFGASSVNLVNFDGTAERVIAPANNTGVSPSFSPSGSRVIYTSNGAIFVADTLGGTPTRVAPASGETAFFGRLISEDVVEYLSRRPDGQTGLYRTSVQGVFPLTLLAILPDFGGTPSQPYGADISPAGTQVVYSNDLSVLRVADIVNGNAIVRSLGVNGGSPRYSPSGTRIAYSAAPRYGVDGLVSVINVDGSGGRRLTTQVVSYGLAWSPDERFVLGRTSSTTLLLTQVSDGESRTIRFANDLYQPSWR